LPLSTTSRRLPHWSIVAGRTFGSKWVFRKPLKIWLCESESFRGFLSLGFRVNTPRCHKRPLVHFSFFTDARRGFVEHQWSRGEDRRSSFTHTRPPTPTERRGEPQGRTVTTDDQRVQRFQRVGTTWLFSSVAPYGGSPASIRASVNNAVSSRAQPTLLNCLLVLNEGCSSSTRATAVLASSRRDSFARGAASST
jgi:hypothetical protein